MSGVSKTTSPSACSVHVCASVYLYGTGWLCMYVSMIDGCPGAPGGRMNYESLLFSSQMQDLAHIGVKLIYLLPLISYARKMAGS